jgi:peptidoglycan hydrolase-like protein with peptidoglycan-binding domain
VTARLDPATAEAALNLRPEDRTVVQESLTALGFDTGGIDGVFGANTRRAMVRWQRDRREEVTSYLTATQYGRLLAEAKPRLGRPGNCTAKTRASFSRAVRRRGLPVPGWR